MQRHQEKATRSTPTEFKKRKKNKSDTESEGNMLKDNCSSCEISNKENQKLKNENFNLKLDIAALSEEVKQLQSTVNSLKTNNFPMTIDKRFRLFLNTTPN